MHPPKVDGKPTISTGPAEFEVRATTPMPQGYTFVPKGNVYITKNCRKKTHEAERSLYVVLDKRKKLVGLRCPTSIYEMVVSQDQATAPQRAEAVLKRDAAIEDNFEEALLGLFPKMPKTEVQQVLKHALKKRSRRVGRTSRVSLQDRVKLAVHAHIRHVHTDYDQLLKQGSNKSRARQEVWDRLGEVARQWGGQAPQPAAEARKKGRRPRKDMVGVVLGTVKQTTDTTRNTVTRTAWRARALTKVPHNVGAEPSTSVGREERRIHEADTADGGQVGISRRRQHYRNRSQRRKAC